MENVRIDTTQNVQIDYTLATLGDRFAAWFIDYLILICWVILMVEFRDVFRSLESDTGMILWIVVMLLPMAFYHLLCELFLNGQSVGKLIMKIKVVKLDGSQPTLGSYLLRWLMRIVEFSLFMGLGLVVFLMSGRGQRLGDIFAGTTVIRKKKKYTLEDTILYNLDKGYKPRYPQVRNLKNRDVEIIKEGLHYSRKHKNYNTMFQLNEQVIKAMGIEDHGMPYAQFLDIVVKDFNYYQVADAMND